jgi:methylenetetrahydrofolate dehydrogenase (NADP+)/methenyltetrahydrofolate cyclohydrolase
MTGELINTIDPEKDADGLTAHNLGLLVRGEMGIMPATPKGIMTLCERSGIELAGKRVVVVGRSFLVGKSTALAFLSKDATVTIAHSKTKHLRELTQNADIVVTAVGKAKFFDRTYFKRGQVVIDVGISEYVNEATQMRNIVGDVDFHDVVQVVDAITPMPGGVGPMTVISLFENVYQIEVSRNRFQ